MTLDSILKIAPVACGIIAFLTLLARNYLRAKENNLQDLFIVSISGSSVPTGALLIYSAFDYSIITKVSDGGVYMAFSGLALLYIFWKTFKEKT